MGVSLNCSACPAMDMMQQSAVDYYTDGHTNPLIKTADDHNPQKLNFLFHVSMKNTYQVHKSKKSL